VESQTLSQKFDGPRIYRASDAPALQESGAASRDFVDAPELAEAALELASTSSSVNRLLVPPASEGVGVVYLFFKPNLPLFLHKHDVDTLYVVISGSIVGFMGHDTLGPGDCFAVSAGTSYYYSAGSEGVEVLEIFDQAEAFTVIFTKNPPGRLEETIETIRENRDAWNQISEGPLFRTRSDPPAAS
jgi:mannose-6-phosphate isomerase-like protein (cupin superfamily)